VLVLWAPGGAWRAKPALARVLKRLGRRAFWPSVKVQSRFWFDAGFPGRQRALNETFAYYRQAMCPGFVRMYWGIAADQIGHSLFDIAPGIAQPTLLMWGDHDNGAGMGAGVARLHELLPDNEFVVFEGARHSLETEIPQRLAATINAFLDRVAAA
jgi:pimeloyl-ACP methyl ester carboxylesterase